jgi:serine/threonine-protein kinase HipA
MRTKCENFIDDARQLWRRLVFNHLITNVDDHLQNIGFLYSGNNLWRLSPAFDLYPFPDKDPESKTWLSEDSGPISSIEQLMGQAVRFELSQSQAQEILDEVVAAVRRWKDVAASPEVGLQSHELDDFKPASQESFLTECATPSSSVPAPSAVPRRSRRCAPVCASPSSSPARRATRTPPATATPAGCPRTR